MPLVVAVEPVGVAARHAEVGGGDIIAVKVRRGNGDTGAGVVGVTPATCATCRGPGRRGLGAAVGALGWPPPRHAPACAAPNVCRDWGAPVAVARMRRPPGGHQTADPLVSAARSWRSFAERVWTPRALTGIIRLRRGVIEPLSHALVSRRTIGDEFGRHPPSTLAASRY